VQHRSLSHRSGLYRAFQVGVSLLFRLLSDFRVEGREHYPATGPYVLVINHLHWLDLPAAFTTFRHFTSGLMKRKWQRHPVAGPIMRLFARAIPIDTDRPDPRAIAAARRWLEGGGVLLVAPEGTRSRQKALAEGFRGAAFLANRTGAPLVPVAMWGQERVFAYWRRLRRAPVRIRVGAPIYWEWSSPRASSEELDACTRAVMRRLAEMLPEEYRGVYAAGEPLTHFAS
jgi:1-acyl-sn-glycerol-3-phosphate acyltransferase